MAKRDQAVGGRLPEEGTQGYRANDHGAVGEGAWGPKSQKSGRKRDSGGRVAPRNLGKSI